MPYRDVSLPIDGRLVVWPGDPVPHIEVLATVARDGMGLSRLTLGSHCGTHIDAPSHFLAGAPSVDSLLPERLMGACRVVDVQAGRGLIAAHEAGPVDEPGVVFKTGARLSAGEFDRAYRSVSLELAQHLVAAGVHLVGIDTLSIEAFDSTDYQVHKTLLQAGVVIVEGLDLSQVEPGLYHIIALPLRLRGVDGSPARVLLGDIATA